MNLSAEARARFGKDDLPLPPDPNFWEVFNKVVGMQEKQFMKLRDNQVGWYPPPPPLPALTPQTQP